MASVASAQGLVPVNLTGGLPFAGSTRMMPIVSGYATSIFNGDVVKPANTGYIQKDTGTATLTPIGVFLGCSWIDPTYGLTFRNYWPASTVPANSQDAIAYICDDPNAVFAIFADGVMAQADLFMNAAVVQGSGSTITGKSGVTLSASSVATTDTLPLRVMGWAGNNDTPVSAGEGPQECLAPGDAYPLVLVRWNFGMHQYQVALGV